MALMWLELSSKPTSKTETGRINRAKIFELSWFMIEFAGMQPSVSVYPATIIPVCVVDLVMYDSGHLRIRC